MVGGKTQLLALNSKSFLNEYLAKNKRHSMMPSYRHRALFMFVHIYLLHGISEKKQKQQTVLALEEAHGRRLNFCQLIKQIQQILKRLFFHLILHTIWKAGSTITGRQSNRMQEAHSHRASWQQVTINTWTVLFLFSSIRRKKNPLNPPQKNQKTNQSQDLPTYIIIHVFE